jgi:hypothetical protein
MFSAFVRTVGLLVMMKILSLPVLTQTLSGFNDTGIVINNMA